MFQRFKKALIVATVVALALPAATFAVTSAPVAETLTISSTVSMTGVPLTFAYGTGVGGGTLAIPEFIVKYSSNNGRGADFGVKVTDMTAGASVLLSTARHFRVGFVSLMYPQGESIIPGYSLTDAAPGAAYTGGNAVMTLVGGTVAVSDFELKVNASVVIPAGQVPGAYTGTITFSFIDR